jgi:polyvinyl alcohol dehydrogenase (cytochrome)
MRTVLLALVMATAAAHGQSAPDGEALYKQHCASCDDAGVPRAAARSVLQQLPPDDIGTTLDVGSMVQQAAALPSAQKEAIIAFLTRDSAPQPAVAVNSQCAPQKQTYSATLSTPHWTGWGNDVTQHRFQSGEQAQLTQLWGPSGAGIWSSPTVDVKKRRVYVTTGNSTADPVAATSDAIIPST